MPKLVLDSGLTLHYQQVGDGPDVVMVHGITGNLAVWHLQLVPALSDRFRVLTYDLRGHGYSGTPPSGYTPDDMADDLLGLLDGLELERPALVGHSYGADITLYFAARHPDRVSQVIAIEPALPALEDLRAHDGWAGWRYWVAALERAGHQVPPERRTDLRYLIHATIDLPKQWGPLQGLPRNPKPLLRLLEQTDAARGLPAGREPHARPHRRDRDAGGADVRRALGVPRTPSSTCASTCRTSQPIVLAADGVGPLRPARAAGAGRGAHRGAARRPSETTEMEVG